MMVPALIAALSSPAPYPFEVRSDIVVKQTHLSVVFLVDDVVYKVKRAVDFGFVDYSTLEKRRRFCEAEVLLNRRMAPTVYIGVVAIRLDAATGSLFVDADEDAAQPLDVVEYAVKMRRLADDDTLLHAVRTGAAVSSETLLPIARLLADFHTRIAARSPTIAQFGAYDNVAFNMSENFRQTPDHVRHGWVSQAVYERVRSASVAGLESLRPVMQERVARGVPCDAHGDLRLEHVYVEDGRISIIDCVEFSDRLRYGDPLSDIAFLLMDLLYETGQLAWSDVLLDEYLSACAVKRTPAVDRLVSWYSCYRSVVRAKVVGLKAREETVQEHERRAAQRRVRRHWHVALTLIEEPGSRPGLIIVTGLPASGKSTIAKALDVPLAVVLRTDTIRKEGDDVAPAYDVDAKRVIYEELATRAAHHLREGKRVIADATFNLAGQVDAFRHVARDLGVIFVILLCQCPDRSAVRRRLERRTGDASDADWNVYLTMAANWQGPTVDTAGVVPVDTSGSIGDMCGRARAALARVGLASHSDDV
ncbi:unnamed protein product (mitochondrion) [Plasmodiophora brassicae]|nr:unnamed protein product [Plasmodiophora brassicae]